MNRLFITGDKHADYDGIEYFCERANTTKDDVMIVLGDNGCNYYGGKLDALTKQRVEDLPLTFIMIRGNHDMRPSDIDTYHLTSVYNNLFHGEFFVEDKFPSLLFTKEYGSYQIQYQNVFVIGGAYSIDKHYRLAMNKVGHLDYRWFLNEQLNDKEREDCLNQVIKAQPSFILTHTCPLKYKPVESWKSIDNTLKNVDETMETWLNSIESAVDYKQWYCGHWHIDKKKEKMQFVYNSVLMVEDMMPSF